MEIKEQVESLAKAWEEFKSVNDARLKEIEKKCSADTLFTGQLEKINGFIDETKSKIDKLETAAARPASSAVDESKEGNPEAIQYKKAFGSYLRKGVDNGLGDLQLKALSVNSEPDGGYLVTPQMSAMITKNVFESSPMRQLATVETISADSLEIIDDPNQVGSGWVAETGTRSETTTAQVGKKVITAQELYAMPKASQKILDDVSMNVEAWLADKIAEKFARDEATAFINGNGVGQPRGILTYAAGTTWGTQIEQVNSGSSGAVTADGLLSLVYSLKDDYLPGSSFLMNRTVMKSVRQLKDTTNQYLWQPSLQLGQPDTLLGFPAFKASDMPVAAANSLSIAFGNFKRAYVIVDRVGIRTLRDPFSSKPFVLFYTTKRVGGDVVNFEAIKIQKLA